MRAVGEKGWYRAGYVLGLVLRAWRRTCRLEIRRAAPAADRWLLATWHGRLLGPLFERMGTPTVSMASRSADGSLAAGALAAVGIRAARGSTGKGGGEALQAMEDMVRNGAASVPALTVDGPRGPWRRVKPGAVVLARRLGIPIVPASFSCRRVWLLRSWDRMVVPQPFSRVVVAFGAPMDPATLPADTDDAAAVVGEALLRLDAALDEEVAGRPLWPPARRGATS